jgi:uncharacterized membrane protein required for colicin V production
MNPHLQQAAGSPLWQLVFISFAVVLVLFEVLSGWRRGIARQMARLGALIAAYFAAYFGGQFLLPLVRPLFKLPDQVLSILAGAALALVIYAVINGAGAMLFRRTRQHSSAFVRLLYGLGGAVVGLFFGAFLVWLLIVAVRSVGTVADVQVHEQTKTSQNGPSDRKLHAIDVRRRILGEATEEPTSLTTTLARLKNSLELGTVGEVVKKTDVIPAKAYENLGKIGQVVSNPQSAERFLAFPGAHELSENPKIVALRDDPEIQELIAQGRYLELLQDERIIDAANDPTLFDQIKRFDLSNALDYALKQQ